MATITCLKCGTRSDSTQLVCTKCGAMLLDPSSSTVHMRIDPARLRLHRNRPEAKPAAAVAAHTVLLQIRGLTERLIFEEGTEFVLGRLDLTQPTARRYDLTRFGAHERGVSREHARLTFKNNQLTVTDLGSVNGTSVNLKKLAPHEPHVLSSGDELMLGRLSITLRFESAPDARRPALNDDTRPTRLPIAEESSKPIVDVAPATSLLDPAVVSKAMSPEKIETKDLEKTPDFSEAPTEKGRPTDMPASLAALQEKQALRSTDNGTAAAQAS